MILLTGDRRRVRLLYEAERRVLAISRIYRPKRYAKYSELGPL